MSPTASRYLGLGNALLVIGTFAGALTFSTLLTSTTLTDHHRNLLGVASALFLGSVTGVFPIFLALQLTDDDQTPSGRWWYFVIVGYSFLAVLISIAFLLLVVVLKQYTTLAAVVLGLCLLGVSAASSLVIALINGRSWL
jgi:hypothetical protein